MLRRLVLTDVRNHAALTLSPGAGFVVFTGANGAGKTNVLEAVSLLAPGRGLRAAALSSVRRIGGAGGFGVAATLADGVELATGALPAAPERRIVRINGAAAPVAALAERLAVTWLTPAMDRLFVEGAAERRRFLDRLVLARAPDHAGHATRYDRAMRERNRLLAEGTANDEWLSALETQMALHGAAIDAARHDLLTAIAPLLAQEDGAGFPRVALSLVKPPAELPMLGEALRAGRARDAAAGRTLTGPHRADLAAIHVDKGVAAAIASTGEQKALLLRIVLSHADLIARARGAPPVLLLDEVAAHLDPDRRAALFARLAARGQVWMTGTERALFDAAGSDATFVGL